MGLNRTAYNVYLLGFALLAVLVLLAADRLPGIGAWASRNPTPFLLVVGGALMVAACLPLMAAYGIIGWLERTAQRAVERFGAGDVAGGQAHLHRLERWTPRLRWLMINPAMVESMKDLVCGLGPADVPEEARAGTSGEAGPGPAGAGPYRVVRLDAHGNRLEVMRFATREEADRRREELDRVSGGSSARYVVEGPSNGRPGGPATP